MIRWLTIAALAAFALPGAAVADDGDAVSAVLRAIPRPKLERLSRSRVYFGHQSVGYDIVRGLVALAKERPELGLKIVEARDPAAVGEGTFAHAKNGRNEEPLFKVADFAATLEGGGLGAKVDIAFFKFCYVDIVPETDVDQLFREYEATLARLRREFPRVRFVHVTSPLTVVQSGPKAWVKQLLGKRLGGAAANVARERFNALLRQAYQGKEPVFDLARVESTLPDGGQVLFDDGGKRYPALAPGYASDGKHLNALGGRWAAAHLLATLASAGD